MAERLALHGGAPAISSLPSAAWPIVADEDKAAVAAMLDRNEIAYFGREGKIAELEDAFARACDVPFALATNNGTSALHAAFFAVGMQPGDEVIGPTYTFLATVMPVVAVNAVPVLVDVDPLTGNIDPAEVERAITPRTRAIVVNHSNGVPVDMAALMALAEPRGIAVVEDASHAHGARANHRPVGSLGHVAAFSLQSNKLVPAGEGGMLVTADRRIFERALLLGHWARGSNEAASAGHGQFAATGLGLNHQMHPLAAALALGALSRLDAVIDARERNFAILDRRLAHLPGVTPPVVPDHVTRRACYGYQPIYDEQAAGIPFDRFVEACVAEGVPVVRPSTPPLHLQPLFRDPATAAHLAPLGPPPGTMRAHRADDFPNSIRYLRTTFRLPVYSVDQPDAMEAIAGAITKVLAAADELNERAEAHR